MVCRTTSIGSAVTSFARIASGLTDDQCLSLYHDLQREASGPAPTALQQTRLINRLIRNVQQDPSLTAARRASIIRRLEASRNTPMSAGQYYGAQHIQARAAASRTALNTWITDVARDTGQSADEVARQFNERLRPALAHEGRGLRAPEDWVNATTIDPRYRHLPLSRATAYAMHDLDNERRAALAARDTRDAEHLRYNVTASGRMREAMYYPESGLAVITTARRTYELRVPEHEMENFSDDPDTALNRWTRSSRYQWETQAQIEEARLRRRCNTCGQWASAARSHTCPVRGSTEELNRTTRLARAAIRQQASTSPPESPPTVLHPTAESFTVTSHDTVIPPEYAHDNNLYANVGMSTEHDDVVRQSAASGQPTVSAVTGFVDVSASPPSPDGSTARSAAMHYSLTGNVTVTHDPESDYFTVTPVTEPGDSEQDNLRCDCVDYRTNYRCIHIATLTSEYERRLNDADIPTVEQRREAEAQVARELAAEHEAAAATQAAAVTSRITVGPPPTTMFSTDPAAFQRVYAAAVEQWNNGEGEVPILYRRSNALSGSRRKYGIEVEFNLAYDPYLSDEEKRDRIASDLYDAGLTSDYRVHAPHSHSYTTELQRGWTLVTDGSCSGELVSPIMGDDERAWDQVLTGLEILKSHGGEVGSNVGGHIHVSTSDYGTVVGNYNRLGGLLNEHEDTLMRLATNPRQTGRMAHRSLRGSTYTSPRQYLAEGYREIESVRHAGGRNNAVNYGHVNEGSAARIEYRLWDGTLDPALVQNDIRLSVALTDYAFGNPDYIPGPPQPMGTARGRSGGRRLTGEDWRNHTQPFRNMIDAIYTNDEDKIAAIGHYAITRSQRSPH